MAFGYPKNLVDDRGVLQKVKFTAEDTTLGVNDRVIVASGAQTLTLPPVSEAAGMEFSVSNETGEAANVVIADAGDSVGWANITLADENAAIVKSDGRRWHTIANTT